MSPKLKDLEQHMDIVRSLKHENVVELKAYYHSKDEKLKVYDYYSQGSILSALLHGMQKLKKRTQKALYQLMAYG
ncbi:Serine-threonine/tyrosine-protein kinase, catalytic domain [Sesbania bispinosa]|nr:Serine-threonine/tyrosine-protein kinase, catalytic domain [Sesbania bispinosa]